jgi:hypothetical protein
MVGKPACRATMTTVMLGCLNNSREASNSRDDSNINKTSNSKDASYNRSIGKSRELLQWLGSQQQHAGVQEALMTTVTVCLEVFTTIGKLAISATQATAGAGTQQQNKKGCLTVEKLATCNSSSMDPRKRR